RPIAAKIKAYSTRSCPSVSIQKRVQNLLIFCPLISIANSFLHQFEVLQGRSKVASNSKCLDQLLAALFVPAHFKQNDCQVVMSRCPIRGPLELFESPFQISALRQSRAEIIARGGGIGIQLERLAEFAFGFWRSFLEQQVVAE